jgi:hypothetical protein
MELIGTAVARSAAAPQAVWDVLVDGRGWSRWSPASEWMVVERALEAGAFVTIKRKRGRQTAYRVETAIAPDSLAFELTIGPAASLRIAWTLAPDGPGTLIRQTIEVAGPLRRWLTLPLARCAADTFAGDPERLAALAMTV